MSRRSLLLAATFAIWFAAACSDPASEADAGSNPADASVSVDAPATIDGAISADAASTVACVPGDDSCTGSQVCRPAFGTNNLVCQEPGDVAMGQHCGSDGVDDCVAAGVCYDVYGTGVNTCRPFCTYDDTTIECPGSNKICVPFFGEQPAGVCIGNNCTPPDTGCPDGQRCAVFMGEVLACMPEGEVPVGGDCEEAYCVAGAGCVNDGGSYTCRTLCDEAADCTVEGTHCEWPWNIYDWGYCADGCDLITQTGCDTAGEACYYSDPEVASTLCWAEGTIGEGETCDFTAMCAPGLDCFLIEGTSDPYEYACRKFCDDTHPCTSGTCQATDLIHGIHLCLP